MKCIILAFVAVFFTAGFSWSQPADWMAIKADMTYYADLMVHAEADVHRIRAHDSLMVTMSRFLEMPDSYRYTLDSIPLLMVVHGKDFRIVTWQLRRHKDEHTYAGFIQWQDRVVTLRDTRPFVNGAAYMSYTPGGWYGCMYYGIVPFEREGDTYYILLGYHAENSVINTKIADVLDLTGPEPRLGVPVFVGDGEPKYRLLLTYADMSNAGMRYDAKLGGIVHDHLERLMGIGPNGEDLPVSDGSLEAWILKKGNWVYKEEVYDAKMKEPPMTDERKNRKEELDILGRPKKN